MTQWKIYSFKQLSTEQLYDVIKLRVDVFVVEQDCPYPDLDGNKGELDRHPETTHLLGYQDNTLVAYLRILPKGQNYADYVSIGRVVTAIENRGSGLGHQLMQQGIEQCLKQYPNQPIKISAQQHLSRFYQQHGFTQVSKMYLEDNIPHIAMLRLVN
ncbi:GNAT family N-acetyltransferase [Colwellia sp. RSH04]|uniref:GNAT family N-acetyltransferase n=1 Tax=Colwellia sp. RSH04 TaxID=2305464 RepID=UPI000E5787E5|nr:GNAT family N-acetyltransferase [Colwellia sp. RSH04]RHW74848.1 GNAT family N-acetyltransferase [Colwellia sp. RSH04]